MSFRITLLFALIGSLCLYSESYAQIEQEGTPLSFEVNLKASAPVYILPAVPENWEKILLADETALKPDLFAWPEIVDIRLIQDQYLIYDDDEYQIYQLKFEAAHAYSLNVIFNHYSLPDGVKVFLYNPDRSTIRGAYTKENNKVHGWLPTTPIPGHQLIVEVNVKKTQLEQLGPLTLYQISSDQKNIFGEKGGKFGTSGDCNVDINCPEGADWQIEKRAVCKFLRGGILSCSGALINNTNNDGRPLLLTANHCIGSNQHAITSVFYFKYESPSCYGPDGPLEYSIASSSLLATTKKLDFALVELTITPPERFDPYYAGWDRQPLPYFDSVTVIHHPSGDVKKISSSNRRITTGDFGGGFDKNTHWWIQEWDSGTTEGGSSGSPLFNRDHKIIGDLTGGDADCSYNYNDYFQKLWVSWDRYPDPDNQLKAWLDPTGVDAMVWNGYDPFGSDKPLANFDYVPKNPEVGKYVRFKDVSDGAPENWRWEFEGGVPKTSDQQHPLVYFNNSGYHQVRLIAANFLGVDTITQTILIEEGIDFNVSQARIVTGAGTHLMNQSSDPSSIRWKIQLAQGHSKEMGGLDDQSIQLDDPGSHSVIMEQVGPSGKTLVHQNMIKVVPDELIFSGQLLSPFSEREVIEPFDLGGAGLIPGVNEIGYEAYANAFYKNVDTTQIVTGVRVFLEHNKDNQGPVWLKTIIWDHDWNAIRSDSVELISSDEPFRVSTWFDPPVGFDSLIYVGFEIPENTGPDFSSGLTITRGSQDENVGWALKDGEWREINSTLGMNVAFGIQLETAIYYDDFNSQIKINPSVINDRVIRLDMGNLVYESVAITVFTLGGKQLLSQMEVRDQQVDVILNQPVSGVYILRIALDHLAFSKKVMILRN